MKKIILSIILLGGANANAQQLLEVLRPMSNGIVNTTPSTQGKAEVWDRIFYIASFNHNGANVDGEINNTNSIVIPIPYNEATGSYNEINVIRAAQDRNGNTKTLTLNIPAGSFNNTKGFLKAKIIVEKNTPTDIYKVKQLPANEEEIITTFSFNINGRTSNVTLIANGGILDKMFNKETNNKLEHQFIYRPSSLWTLSGSEIPDKGKPYERTWLAENLGAEVTDANNPRGNFYGNLTNISSCRNKEGIYSGSRFQWQRPADGHEIIHWRTNDNGSGCDEILDRVSYSTFSSVVSGVSDRSNWTAEHSNFIIGNKGSWVSERVVNDINNHNLWQNGQTNNPCPTGYYVPTQKDWEETLSSMYRAPVYSTLNYLINEETLLYSQPHFFEYATLFRRGDGSIDGPLELYYSSSPYYSKAIVTTAKVPALYIHSDTQTMISGGKVNNSFGIAIRCIKD